MLFLFVLWFHDSRSQLQQYSSFCEDEKFVKLSTKSNELIFAYPNFGFSLFQLLVPANNGGKLLFINKLKKIVFNMSPCFMAL